MAAEIFLSTPSARRATLPHRVDLQSVWHFYPRPPRGGRPSYLDLIVLYSTYFYPRPPRGGRRAAGCREDEEILFLSTPSARRATYIGLEIKRPFLDFYPRPPRGGRLISLSIVMAAEIFLSTPSARRATTTTTVQNATNVFVFLSTPSARRATFIAQRLPRSTRFLSTPSARRATAASG